MPTIIETIIDYEPDMLEMIAEGWGIDQDLDAGKNQPKQIANLLQDESLIDEVMQALPEPDFGALIRLARSDGRLPLDQFEREFGSLREMGAARRGKIRPDRNPISITETLFYKGLIARAFFKEGTEALEFVYIPDEFLAFLDREINRQDPGSIPLLPESSAQHTFHASDFILDHACTLLAALRAGIPTNNLQQLNNPEIPTHFLTQLLIEAKLINEKRQVNPKKTREFLEASRAESFSSLVESWQNSLIVNEIQLLEKLKFEGNIKRNPLIVREKLLAFIQPLSGENWLQIEEFVAWVKTYQPDFLRTGGEYESWIIKDVLSGQYIKGFKYWNQVEGALLRKMIRGPFFWMGMVDLGMKTKAAEKPELFRLSKWAKELLAGRNISYQKRETPVFTVNKDGRIIIERSFPLSLRYQIARFCEWGEVKKGRYQYKISHSALQRSIQQGLKVEQLIVLINKYGKKPVPPTIPAALERWKLNELEAVFEQVVILRVRSAQILDQLMDTRAKTYILTRLNETNAIVKPNAVGQLRDILMDSGILADIRLEV